VKFSLDRARADDSTNAQKALFADIASVEVVDPATVKVTLSKPNGVPVQHGLGRCGHRGAGIAADIAEIRSAPAPSLSTEWVKGDRVELGRTPTTGAPRSSSTR
jgi:peptide/nickel transport system substrate-binding protein